jgi:hypothetical protein
MSIDDLLNWLGLNLIFIYIQKSMRTKKMENLPDWDVK